MSMATIITMGRIVGAFILLLITPFSVLFFVIYAACCASDVLDGYVARKKGTTSRFGEVFDSIADFIFVMAMLVIFIPLIDWDSWMLFLIGSVAIIRFLTLGIGFAKYRALSFLHTYANKVTGIALVCFPILYYFFGVMILIIALGSIASYSALEELIITIRSRNLNRNVKGLFYQNNKKISE